MLHPGHLGDLPARRGHVLGSVGDLLIRSDLAMLQTGSTSASSCLHRRAIRLPSPGIGGRGAGTAAAVAGNGCCCTCRPRSSSREPRGPASCTRDMPRPLVDSSLCLSCTTASAHSRPTSVARRVRIVTAFVGPAAQPRAARGPAGRPHAPRGGTSAARRRRRRLDQVGRVFTAAVCCRGRPVGPSWKAEVVGIRRRARPPAVRSACPGDAYFPPGFLVDAAVPRQVG